MSAQEQTGLYLFHTQLGAVTVEINTVRRYDVEDIVRERAISQARAIQFLRAAKDASPNDPAGDRTIGSSYIGSDEELAE